MFEKDSVSRGDMEGERLSRIFPEGLSEWRGKTNRNLHGSVRNHQKDSIQERKIPGNLKDRGRCSLSLPAAIVSIRFCLLQRVNVKYYSST